MSASGLDLREVDGVKHLERGRLGRLQQLEGRTYAFDTLLSPLDPRFEGLSERPEGQRRKHPRDALGTDVAHLGAPCRPVWFADLGLPGQKHSVPDGAAMARHLNRGDRFQLGGQVCPEFANPIAWVGKAAGGPWVDGASRAFLLLPLRAPPPQATRWASSVPVLPPFAIAAGAAGDR
jgi:hypothetical protein